MNQVLEAGTIWINLVKLKLTHRRLKRSYSLDPLSLSHPPPDKKGEIKIGICLKFSGYLHHFSPILHTFLSPVIHSRCQLYTCACFLTHLLVDHDSSIVSLTKFSSKSLMSFLICFLTVFYSSRSFIFSLSLFYMVPFSTSLAPVSFLWFFGDSFLSVFVFPTSLAYSSSVLRMAFSRTIQVSCTLCSSF